MPHSGIRFLHSEYVRPGLELANGKRVQTVRRSARKIYLTFEDGSTYKEWRSYGVPLLADPPGYHDCMPRGND